MYVPEINTDSDNKRNNREYRHSVLSNAVLETLFIPNVGEHVN